MMKKVHTLLLAVSVLLAVSLIPACEDRDTANSITVTPQTTQMSGVGTVVLTASSEEGDLVTPLIWTVSNPSLGGILNSAGVSAVYESNGTGGQNSVTVIDQTDREGVAVVEQR